MTVIGWIAVVIGALVNYLAKPILTKVFKKDAEAQSLYAVKLAALMVVILGVILIFIAEGRVNG